MKALKFSATWCAPCKLLTKNLVGHGITLEEFDIDTHMTLAAKYGVRSVPTIVITDDDGNKLEFYIGPIVSPTLLERLKSLNV